MQLKCVLFAMHPAAALFPFGEIVGDTLVPQGLDVAFGPNQLETPVVFFQGNETTFYVCKFNTQIG